MSKTIDPNINSDPRITTVLFDMDDTLIDSFRAREDSLKTVLKAGGIHLDDGWTLDDFRGLELRDILRQNGIKEEELEKHFSSYRRIYWTGKRAPIELFAGVRQMLEKLYEHGTKMGVVTQKGREFFIEGCRSGAATELETVSILSLFKVVVGLEDVVKLKPDPEGINLALAELQSRPEETLFVGDSLSDMLAAKNAGCHSCHARWGIAEPEDLGADCIAATPQQIANIVIPKSGL